MTQSDSGRERRRLAQRYAGMNDAELREIARNARSLTEAAKAALRAEIARRGLDFTIGDPEPARPPGGPIVLRRYLWLHEALLAQSILDSANIECVLADEHTIRMDWFWSLALGEVKLWVRAEDVPDAAKLLDQDWIESFVVQGVGEYVQPRCPKCGSLNISHRNLLKRLAYFSLLLFWLVSIVPPIALHELGWKCYECGHLWEELQESSERAQ
jgi:hypothetical protein